MNAITRIAHLEPLIHAKPESASELPPTSPEMVRLFDRMSRLHAAISRTCGCSQNIAESADVAGLLRPLQRGLEELEILSAGTVLAEYAERLNSYCSALLTLLDDCDGPQLEWCDVEALLMPLADDFDAGELMLRQGGEFGRGLQ